MLLCHEGNLQVQAAGSLYSEGRLTEGFWRYEFGGVIFGGAFFRSFTLQYGITPLAT